MTTTYQPENSALYSTEGYEAVPDTESLLRAIPGLHYNSRPLGSTYPSLYDSLGIDAAQMTLAEAKQAGPVAYDQARIELARHATRMVSQAVWFYQGEKGTIGSTPPSLGEMEDKQYADCYGHTILLSACLQQLGIQHNIGYTNGHTFVLLSTGSGRATSTWMLDAVPTEFHRDISSPTSVETAFSQGVGDIILGQGLQSAADQITRSGRGVITIDARGLAKLARPHDTFEQAIQRHPWLNATGRQATAPSESEAATLTVSVFDSTVGRDILARHLAFQRAVGTSDFQSAAQLALGLAGRFPDLEVRNSDLIRGLRLTTHNLCKQGSFQLASGVTDAFFSSLGGVTDANAALWEGEIRADIAAQLLAELGRLAMGHSRLIGKEEAPAATALAHAARAAAEHSLRLAAQRRPELAREIAARLAQMVAIE